MNESRFRKKVLIISHGFPGHGGRGNFKIIKYLPLYGYTPIIITNKEKNPYEKKVYNKELGSKYEYHKTICINKTPFAIFSKLFDAKNTQIYLEKMFFIPDNYITWVPSAILKAIKIIRKHKINLVVTASPPESTHIIGLFLKRQTGIKWIADFRDLWTTKEIVYRPPSELHNRIIKRIENIIYKEADHIIANTYGNKNIYENVFKIPKQKITVITNGYDPNETKDIERKQNRKFQIGYMGQFDKNGFPWKELLLSIKRMVNEDGYHDIEVNICGSVSRSTKRFIVDEKLSKHVLCHRTFPHYEAIRKIGENELLLLLMYETQYSSAIVPHKLYNYLGMSKPIMAIAEENGEVAKIIKATNSGTVISISRSNGIYKSLCKYYCDWKNNEIQYLPNKKEIEKYNILMLTKKFADTFTACCMGKNKFVDSHHGS